MKKLTKKQLAVYPAFIARIDFKAKYGRLKAVALKSKKITAALKETENMISTQVYLVDLLQQIGNDVNTGEPVYQAALRTRVSIPDSRRTPSPAEWHLPDEEHDEYRAMSYYTWQPSEGEFGDLGFVNVHDIREAE